MKQVKIIYVGSLWHGSTAEQRMQALSRIGHSIYPIESSFQHRDRVVSSFVNRIFFKLGYPRDLAGANKEIIRKVGKEKFDILWIDKGLTINPNSLKAVKALDKNIIIVGYSPDDMAQRHNQSKYFLESTSYYDYFFTTKSYNVEELGEMGVRRPIFISNSYDPIIHRPYIVPTEERKIYASPVGFIGAFEEDRAEYIRSIAEIGINVSWWGWQGNSSWVDRYHNLAFMNKPLWGEAYSKAINCFDISLCFLRKINRDKQTTRSVEIPACGGFMLAERSEEHTKMFREGIEAEFFSSKQELIEKTKYYLAHPNERNKIANAGFKRCIESGYSHDERLRKAILRIIG